MDKLPDIKSKIYTIRGFQVMLDSDLAELYSVETKVLNQTVKRNFERFPEKFMFQLTEIELDSLRSQIVTLDNDSLRYQNGTLNAEILKCQIGTSSDDSLRSQIVTLEKGRGKHRKYLPFAFTEQGVAMLSGILKSETAVRISIQIMDAFVSMRRFIAANAGIFQRLDRVEVKQLEHDKRFEEVFDAIQGASLPKMGIFFDGQVFDAYKFVSDLIRSAKRSIVLIDNYVDDSVLTLFLKRDKDVMVVIYTTMSKQLALDLEKHNSQYLPIIVKEFSKSHDRFLLIDDTIYHFGASLKDLGRRWFAFSKMEKASMMMVGRIK